MCGICGFVDRQHGGAQASLEATVEAMALTLVRRGPDSSGVWADASAGVAFGHRRLAIVDLSAAGHQPMQSACGRYWLTYNGEVYNFADLRKELRTAGVTFTGDSDTEVIVNGCARWGVTELTRRLNGMFAFALWDTEARALTLVRDRIGIKPLYWALHDGVFLFGSELKALRKHPGFSASVDPRALASYLRHNYVPAPMTIYRDVQKLPAGTILTLGTDNIPRIEPYWDARQVAVRGRAAPRQVSPDDAVDELEQLLMSAVGGRMVADVPLGAFLSGGIDSSVVVALMQAQSSRPVRTFSIGFDVPGYNEATHAKAVAQHLGTDHTELYLTAQQTLDVVPELSTRYDEPFADSSQIPMHLVSKLARQHVTVALSGDGGDELFAGYRRYAIARQRWRSLNRVPSGLRRTAAGAIGAVPERAWRKLLGAVPDRYLPATTRSAEVAGEIGRLTQLVRAATPEALYLNQISQWQSPLDLTGGGDEPKTAAWDATLASELPDYTDRMRLVDALMYLPDDILTKVDRASMAVSLEARVPLLDHRVFEFAWTLPRELLERDGIAKWPLRKVLYRYVPQALIDRPKMGFGVPVDQWLRGPLREWAEDLLQERKLREAGHLNPAPIRRAWNDYLTGQRANHYPLWTVLMFQAWQQRWM